MQDGYRRPVLVKAKSQRADVSGGTKRAHPGPAHAKASGRPSMIVLDTHALVWRVDGETKKRGTELLFSRQ